ncbi:MAG: rRNA pseudouridine synthase [Muribaculaceae bacterium]|nr:rRNA pseudouridine synthase [Muribaculaceae bacterium]
MNSEDAYKRYNSDPESQAVSSENSYRQPSSESVYQQHNRQNGYGRQNNYGMQQKRQNNFNRQGGYGSRQGGRPGGYQQHSNNGYNRQNGGQQNGYQNRQNGYGRPGGNQQGGYQKRQGGFQKTQKPGMKFTPRPRQIDYIIDDIDPNEPIRLNKYMANSGICSRREADEKIAAGLVTVNDVVVTELGTKINRDDVVKCDDKVVTPERKCYVLLNKPKDCVTTSDDPNGRMTVLDVVKGACQERIYPVGRLDRNTTGVLLLTNDGELASKLTHPKFVKKKIYHVWTDKDITEEDMQRIADGIELEDGEIHADAISYANDTDRNQAGIEIHSGRNRIVRRIFEHLGYRVTKLDRVYFAGLTKKNLPRGRWRYLTQEEVNFLRMGSFE